MAKHKGGFKVKGVSHEGKKPKKHAGRKRRASKRHAKK